MAWVFAAIVRVETRFDRWIAQVRLSTGGDECSIFLDYLQEPSAAQVQADAEAQAAALNENAAEGELQGMILLGDWHAPQFQTGAQLAARFRADYLTATQVQAYRMAYWIIERIATGDLTDTQVRNAFSLNTSQYTALKSRLQTRHDALVTMLAAVGE